MSTRVKRNYREPKCSKEIERILLPDAPPRKHSRNTSPNRMECRLLPGTPSTPPTPKTQLREFQHYEIMCADKKQLQLALNSPSVRAALESELNTPSSTGSYDSEVEVPGHSPSQIDWSIGHLKQNGNSDYSIPPPCSTKPISPEKHGTNSASRRCNPVRETRFSKKQGTCSIPRPRKSLPGPSAIKKSSTSSAPSPYEPVPGPNATGKSVTSPMPSPRKPVPGPNASEKSGTSFVPSSEPVSELQSEEAASALDSILAAESDGEEDDLLAIEHQEDFVNIAPAHVPEDLEEHLVDWLHQTDVLADQQLRQLSSDCNYLTFDWSNDSSTFQGLREEFRGNPGPTFPVDETTRPIDVFLKFLDEDFFELLVTHTNRYSLTGIQRPLRQFSRFKFWKDTDSSEMAIFIAILILQGLAPLPVERYYWHENGYLTLKYFKNLMSYNRFALLKGMIHFTDEDEQTEKTTDDKKLRKIKPILDYLRKKFKALYIPSRDIAIDESLMKWHGRLSFAQKIATKAAKVGVKSYELCESSTGYLWNFFVYTGKGSHGVFQNETDQSDGLTNGHTDGLEGGLDEPERQTDGLTDIDTPPPPSIVTSQIVYELVKPLLGQGYSVAMDNFYNSPLLARFLKSNGTDCYGTLRVNREFVPETIKNLGKNDLRTGEVVQSYCKDVAITMWRDSNVVSLLSTFHKGMVGGKEKYGRYKFKPEVVLEYNKTMGGVDKKDQLLSSHPMERGRNMAWYKKTFRRLINVTVLNSFIIYKTKYPNVTQRAFRSRLAEELIEKFLSHDVERPLHVTTSTLALGPSVNRPILTGNHFLGLGPFRKARCTWCKLSRTRYICKQCKVSLCLEICMEEYHTKK